jgi:hypothetical protein
MRFHPSIKIASSRKTHKKTTRSAKNVNALHLVQNNDDDDDDDDDDKIQFYPTIKMTWSRKCRPESLPEVLFKVFIFHKNVSVLCRRGLCLTFHVCLKAFVATQTSFNRV